MADDETPWRYLESTEYDDDRSLCTAAVLSTVVTVHAGGLAMGQHIRPTSILRLQDC